MYPNIEEITDKKISIQGARSNNLKDVNIDFPLSVMTVVTGVSGSGKSSLVNEILYKSLAQKLINPKLNLEIMTKLMVSII